MFSPSTIGCLTNWLVPQTGSQQKWRLGKCFYFMPYHVKIDKCKKNKAHKLRSKFIRFKFIRHLSESRVCCLSRIHTPLRDIHGTSVLKAVISWSAQSDLPEVLKEKMFVSHLVWTKKKFICCFFMWVFYAQNQRRCWEKVWALDEVESLHLYEVMECKDVWQSICFPTPSNRNHW